MIRHAAPLAIGLVLFGVLHGCANAPEQDAAERPAQRVFSPPVFEAIAPEESEPRLVETGLASWYGPGFDGNLTASGEIFDAAAMSAAHPSLPLPSLARVTCLESGRSVLVRVNDRGPFVEDRIIDLSQAAAEALGMLDNGIAEVRIEALGPPDLHDRAAPPEFRPAGS